MPEHEITELRDLVPATIGIVDAAAIRRKFLTMKRALPFADLPIVDKPKPDETEAELLDGLLGPDGDNWDAVASAFLWFDNEAAAERGEPAREDYKLPIGRRDDDDTVRVYFEKVGDALGAINGGRGGVDIPAADKQRAFDVGLQYYRKLNRELPDDEQKELPEFTGISRREHLDDDKAKQDAPKAKTAETKPEAVTVTKTDEGVSFAKPAPKTEPDMPTAAVKKQSAEDIALAMPQLQAYVDSLEDEDLKAAALRLLEAAATPVEQQEEELDDVAMAKRAVAKADPAVQAMLKKLEQRAADAETIALDERDRRLIREAVAKAETEFGKLGDSADMAIVLKAAAAKLAPDENEKLLGIFTAANTLVDESNTLFHEIGKRQNVNSDSAEGKVRTLAKARVEAKLNPTMEQAMAAVLEADPGLHAEYVAEQKADRR